MTTIQDIADKMGISKSTVSKALNDAPDISETLREQVLETAVALGYTKLRRYKKPVKKICIIIEKENILYEEPHHFAYLSGSLGSQILQIRHAAFLRAMHQHGLKTSPTTTGCSYDLPIAAYTSPPLTTIRQDRIELGKSGFFALSSLLNGVSISTFLLHAQLIERKSTEKVPVYRTGT